MNTEQRHIKAHIVNGFVTNGRGGNPAGVVLNADNYSESDMLNIAQRIGLSETAFVSESQSEAFKLDFFTPNRRIAHCGHATIATFSYLAESGVLKEGGSSKETVDGPRKILIKNGAAYMEQLAPSYYQENDWISKGVTIADVLASLNISKQSLNLSVPITLVNTGNSFMIIGVRSGEDLKNITPKFELITEISEKLDLIGYYVYTVDETVTDKDATTRMFAPRFAIEEESATGMAAGPLACYLHDYLGAQQNTFHIEQGTYMEPASTSLISVELEVESGKIIGLMAGGYGQVMRDLDIYI
ncbi:PhzF family phenazine biosynthesis protein [Vibrio sp. ZSDE26]|uniref:PhzF family phenazine biosynthesis protein n=1 Tax=Vibrio amylolyticus TaxID=2847292 RepID=A0A9X1XLX0_9VIBR|nr:PhzF family phenazine biosynthesis protein [Vibrio amylolyticus]MCK6264630.1 PhzF family phenazine biosynthesis protein [Vibrio amylolyticus]